MPKPIALILLLAFLLLPFQPALATSQVGLANFVNNRLTQAQITAAGQTVTENYTYSPIGNITSKTSTLPGANVGAYEYTDPRHPHAVTRAGSSTYGYDESGNLVSENRSGENITYQYDFLNRLTAVTTASGTTSYGYSDSYERIQKTLPSGQTRTYLGELAEVDSSGVFTDYLFAGKIRVATVDSTGLYYHTADHLSSASLITNASGALVQKLDYYPFGTERLNEQFASFAARYTYPRTNFR